MIHQLNALIYLNKTPGRYGLLKAYLPSMHKYDEIGRKQEEKERKEKKQEANSMPNQKKISFALT